MAFGVVSGVGRGMGVSDGVKIVEEEDGSPGGKRGTSRCNQWGLCGLVILCRGGGDAALPELFWDFLLLLS